MEITKEQGRLLFQNDDYEQWLEIADEMFPEYDITTTNRIAGFIAQCGHESSNFKRLEENLNYSASRLNQVFPKYFRRAGRDANQYHRQPEKIANVVYAGRMGNGNTASGEGWKFRGRGIIQLTGKNNYSNFARSVDRTLDETVEYLKTKQGAFESACWYWNQRKINFACDANDIVKMTKLINGGTHGLSDRRRRYHRAQEILAGHISSTTNIFLKKGSRGSEVVQVQRLLGLTTDGIFGRNTEKAVIKWQMANFLVADGIVGPTTWSKMFG